VSAPICAECRFCGMSPEYGLEKEKGRQAHVCRRCPPRMVHFGEHDQHWQEGFWPIVSAGFDWCGEFRQREADDEA
jgi:hypothetical protein